MDLETEFRALLCSIYYREPEGTDWNELDIHFNESSQAFNCELKTTKTFKTGNYSFFVELRDDYGSVSLRVYANETVWVQNNPPQISDKLDNIKVGKTQTILKLSDYGYDVETAKSELRWIIDESTLNNQLFHIETNNLGKQEISIYPEPDTTGKDDITLILIDSDGDKVVRSNITIIVNSKIEGGGKGTDPEESGVAKLVGSNLNLLIIVLIIIIIIIVMIMILYLRKKKRSKEAEEDVKKELLTAEPPAPALQPSIDTAQSVLEGAPTPTPVPAIEAPQEAVPVPMPAVAPVPALPVATTLGERQEAGGERREEPPSTGEARGERREAPPTAGETIDERREAKEPEEPKNQRTIEPSEPGTIEPESPNTRTPEFPNSRNSATPEPKEIFGIKEPIKEEEQ